MNGYASNPAPLDSNIVAVDGGGSFLARKGEAAPAVDAQAHAGTDVEDYAQTATGTGIKSGHRRKARANPEYSALYRAPRGVRREQASGQVEAQPVDPAVIDVEADTTMEMRLPPTAREAWFANRKTRRARFDRESMRAVVTFKMPITDFFRLKNGSASLDMTCQAILLDAVDCYLEANDIDALSLDEAKREAVAFSKTGMSARRKKPA